MTGEYSSKEFYESLYDLRPGNYNYSLGRREKRIFRREIAVTFMTASWYNKVEKYIVFFRHMFVFISSNNPKFPGKYMLILTKFLHQHTEITRFFNSKLLNIILRLYYFLLIFNFIDISCKWAIPSTVSHKQRPLLKHSYILIRFEERKVQQS